MMVPDEEFSPLSAMTCFLLTFCLSRTHSQNTSDMQLLTVHDIVSMYTNILLESMFSDL